MVERASESGEVAVGDDIAVGEELFRGLFENHGAPQFLVDPATGRILDANPAAARFYGWERERLRRMRIQEINTLTPAEIAAEMEKARSQRRTHFTFRHRRADGSIRDVSVFSSRVEVRGREILHSIVHDETEQRQATEALARSEARFRVLADAAPVGIFQTDAGGRNLYLNQAAQRITGQELEAARGAGWKDAVHPDDREAVARDWARSVAAGGPFRNECRFQAPDGSVKVVQGHSAALRDADGRVVGHIGVLVDVTEQRRADRAIAEQKDELDAIVHTALDGFWMVDLQGRILDVNDSACAMLGYRREEMLALNLADVEASMTPEHIEATTRRIVAERHVRFESRHRRKDGTFVDVEVSVQYLPFGGGHIVAFVRDTTARRQAEEQLRQSQKMEAVGRLAGGIAHDFNNLLTVMLSASGLALEQAQAGSRLREEIEEFRGAAEGARLLTKQLLAFSRRQVMEPRVIGLNGVVLDTERILRRVLGEHVVLRTRLTPQLAPVYADPQQLQQVVMNLAINAKDAMPAGGILTIETTDKERPHACGPEQCPRSSACVQLAVEDTGVGMDESTRARIFEPFFTTKPEGKGTGLGLSTVFGIVRQSGGAIRVRSDPGQGTRFEICFPRAEQAPEAAGPPANAPREEPVPSPPPPRAASGGGETVLVVEDDEMVRRVAVRTLRRAGFDVLAVGTLEDAMRALQGHARTPALLLTDVRMPGRTGPEVSEAMTALLPGLRTVYMSGYPDDELAEAGGVPSTAAFVQKPFTAEDLVRTVREVLDGARA